MATYKVRSLPRDTARCEGSNCRQKNQCARHTQIEKDREFGIDTTWIVYADASRNEVDCDFMIGEM
jgi:hypothetical protein